MSSNQHQVNTTNGKNECDVHHKNKLRTKKFCMFKNLLIHESTDVYFEVWSWSHTNVHPTPPSECLCEYAWPKEFTFKIGIQKLILAWKIITLLIISFKRLEIK